MRELVCIVCPRGCTMQVEKDGVMGAVLGRSLYEGTIDFAEAQKLVGVE